MRGGNGNLQINQGVDIVCMYIRLLICLSTRLFTYSVCPSACLLVCRSI